MKAAGANGVPRVAIFMQFPNVSTAMKSIISFARAMIETLKLHIQVIDQMWTLFLLYVSTSMHGYICIASKETPGFERTEISNTTYDFLSFCVVGSCSGVSAMLGHCFSVARFLVALHRLLVVLWLHRGFRAASPSLNMSRFPSVVPFLESSRSARNMVSVSFGLYLAPSFPVFLRGAKYGGRRIWSGSVLCNILREIMAFTPSGGYPDHI